MLTAHEYDANVRVALSYSTQYKEHSSEDNAYTLYSPLVGSRTMWNKEKEIARRPLTRAPRGKAQHACTLHTYRTAYTRTSRQCSPHMYIRIICLGRLVLYILSMNAHMCTCIILICTTYVETWMYRMHIIRHFNHRKKLFHICKQIFADDRMHGALNVILFM